MNDSAWVSLEKKSALYRQCYLLTEVAEYYANQKGSVRALRKIVSYRQKALKDSRYPMEQADLSEAIETFAELDRTLIAFLHAKKFDKYRLAEDKLLRFRDMMKKKIAECDAELQEKPTVQETIGAAVNKAKELGGILGKGVEQLKKTVKDLGSK